MLGSSLESLELPECLMTGEPGMEEEEEGCIGLFRAFGVFNTGMLAVEENEQSVRLGE